MGGLGLPGDLSSASRFARVAFVKQNSISGNSETESVSQFFHILNSVDQQRGCCEVADGKYEITLYTSCCNATQGIYYYTTYDNHQISAVDMHRENLDGETLRCFAPVTGEQIDALVKPGRDPRPEFKAARFADGVEDIKDLREGMVLEGVVSNVAAFGAFVDIGVHQDGLVHISALSNKFVKDPREVVKAGDVVKVKVLEVDLPRQRIALTMRLTDDTPAAPKMGGVPMSNKAKQQQALIAYQKAIESAFKDVKDALVNLSEYAESDRAQEKRVQIAGRTLETGLTIISVMQVLLDSWRADELIRFGFVRLNMLMAALTLAGLGAGALALAGMKKYIAQHNIRGERLAHVLSDRKSVV